MRTFVAVAVLTVGMSVSSDPVAADSENYRQIARKGGTGLYLAAGPGPRRHTTVVDNSQVGARKRKAVRRRCPGPDYDARCIRVISDPAIVPPGVNPTAGPVGQFSRNKKRFDRASDYEYYPACSRVDTDNCVQTYERSRDPR